ncbi:MAG: hypothetical protein HRU03_06385 [Nanoarchaeales archaeon]|nr:hypothetical protein [Nanoarchaeales archaeon]
MSKLIKIFGGLAFLVFLGLETNNFMNQKNKEYSTCVKTKMEQSFYSTFPEENSLATNDATTIRRSEMMSLYETRDSDEYKHFSRAFSQEKAEKISNQGANRRRNIEETCKEVYIPNL